MTIKTLEGMLPLDQNTRPMAMIVQIASRYESCIHIDNGEMKANAKSIMGMMTLSMGNVKQLEISAEGPDEKEAVEALSNYMLQV